MVGGGSISKVINTPPEVTRLASWTAEYKQALPDQNIERTCLIWLLLGCLCSFGHEISCLVAQHAAAAVLASVTLAVLEATRHHANQLLPLLQPAGVVTACSTKSSDGV